MGLSIRTGFYFSPFKDQEKQNLIFYEKIYKKHNSLRQKKISFYIRKILFYSTINIH